jgi:hypothetical protein
LHQQISLLVDTLADAHHSEPCALVGDTAADERRRAKLARWCELLDESAANAPSVLRPSQSTYHLRPHASKPSPFMLHKMVRDTLSLHRLTKKPEAAPARSGSRNAPPPPPPAQLKMGRPTSTCVLCAAPCCFETHGTVQHRPVGSGFHPL